MPILYSQFFNLLRQFLRNGIEVSVFAEQTECRTGTLVGNEGQQTTHLLQLLAVLVGPFAEQIVVIVAFV